MKHIILTNMNVKLYSWPLKFDEVGSNFNSAFLYRSFLSLTVKKLWNQSTVTEVIAKIKMAYLFETRVERIHCRSCLKASPPHVFEVFCWDKEWLVRSLLHHNQDLRNRLTHIIWSATPVAVMHFCALPSALLVWFLLYVSMHGMQVMILSYKFRPFVRLSVHHVVV